LRNPTITPVAEAVTQLVRQYPPGLRVKGESDVPRHTFHVEVITSLAPPGSAVCDVGGGFSLVSPTLARIGYRATVVDDFENVVGTTFADGMMPLFHELGVNVVKRDVIEGGLDFPGESFDVVCSFESIEHWHHSPKRLMHDIARCLKPGGWFFLGAPNCVNLRKRLTVPFGRGKWSQMSDWYEPERFRGHVREPDLDDYRYIARDMGVQIVRIIGRNWQGYATRRRWARAITPLVDRPLRPFPTLCSDIYMVARKPLS
jgi:SAM-dependent methyltransferase